MNRKLMARIIAVILVAVMAIPVVLQIAAQLR